MKTLLRLLALPVLALSLVGCASNTSNSFVTSERQNYKAVKPLLDAYAVDHPEFAPSVADKEVAWDKKLTEAEKATATK